MGKLGDFDTAHTLSDQDVVSTLAHIHTVESEIAASRLALLAEADRRGLALELGHSSMKRWYSRATRTPEGNTAHQIALGYWLSEHRTVADALTDATIHYQHARAIADGHALITTADPTLDDDAQNGVIAVLLDVATRSMAKAVTERAHELAHHAAADAQARAQARKAAEDAASDEDTTPDGPADESAAAAGESPAGAGEDTPAGPAPLPVAENTALNWLAIIMRANGRGGIEGDFDALTIEKLKTALSELNAPAPGPDGTPDPRSPRRRTADAFQEILDRYLRGRGTSSTGGGTDVKLIVALSDLMKKQTTEDGTGANPRSGDDRGCSGDGGAGAGGARGADTDPHSGDNRRTGRERGADTDPPDASGENSSGNEDSRDDDGTGTTPRGGDDRGPSGDGGSGSGSAGNSAARGPGAPTPGDADWPFHLDWTGAISRHLAHYLTCDANLTPVIVDDHGVPLMLGRTIRLATAGQREALTIRDRCCVMCGRPAQWCVAHHIQYWEHGGRTDLDNLALLCRECHRQVHNTEWQLHIGDDGHPYAIPPTTIDPQQQPIPSYHRRRKRSA